MRGNQLVVRPADLLVKFDVRSATQTASLGVLVKNSADEQRVITNMRPKQETPVRAWRDSARSGYRKCIVRRDDVSPRKSGAGSRAKMFPATTQRNRKAFGPRFRPVAGRGERARKNKTETRSEDVRSGLESRQPIADDPEWNRASRHHSIDRPEKPDRFANAPACAR